MFTRTSWVHTTKGPQRVADLIDIPHFNVSRNHKEQEVLQGFTSAGLQNTVRIVAQGHEVEVGRDQLIHLTAATRLPAHFISRNQEIQMFVTEREWTGFGTFEEGEHFGQIIQISSWREVLNYCVQKDLDVSLATWLISKDFRDKGMFEYASSQFYDGFFKTFVVDHVEFDDIFWISCPLDALTGAQLLRMMLRRGLFAFQNEVDEIVLPSNTLRQLIVSTGSHGSVIAQQHWSDVSNVPQPLSYTVNVDAITEGVPQELFETRDLASESAIEVNGFQVAARP